MRDEVWEKSFWENNFEMQVQRQYNCPVTWALGIFCFILLARQLKHFILVDLGDRNIGSKMPQNKIKSAPRCGSETPRLPHLSQVWVWYRTTFVLKFLFNCSYLFQQQCFFHNKYDKFALNSYLPKLIQLDT